MRRSKFVVDENAVLGGELRGVIVHAEGHAGGFDLFPDTVELAGDVAPVVQRWFAFGGGVAVDSAGRRADDVFEAQRMGVVDPLIELRHEIVQSVVGADATQPCLVHGVAKLRCGFVVVPGGFDLSICHGAQLVQRAVEVLGQLLAHGIELQADGHAEMRCGKAPSAHTGCGCNGAGSLQKSSTRRLIHLTILPG